MTKHNISQAALGQSAQGILGTLLDCPLKNLLALVHEWWTRRNIKRSLGDLSVFYLRDVGLTKADVEAACTDSFFRPASHSLKDAAQSQMGNW